MEARHYRHTYFNYLIKPQEIIIMKTSIKTALTALALTALVAGPAAANLSGQSIEGWLGRQLPHGNSCKASCLVFQQR